MILRCGRSLCYDTETKKLHIEQFQTYDDGSIGEFTGPGPSIPGRWHLVQKSWWSAWWKSVLSGGQAVQHEHPIDFPDSDTALIISAALKTALPGFHIWVTGNTQNPTSYAERPEFWVMRKSGGDWMGPFDFGEVMNDLRRMTEAEFNVEIVSQLRSAGIAV